MPYYYAGRDGDSFEDATIHTDRDCAAADTDDDQSVRPIAESTLGADAGTCPDCAGGDGDDADGTTGTCDTIKSDGEVCGRDLPCPYHD